MPKINQAKELLLLSAVAFQNGKIEQAGKLYVAALSADGAAELMQSIQEVEVSESKTKKKPLNFTIEQICRSMSSSFDPHNEDPTIAMPGTQQGLAEDEDDEDFADTNDEEDTEFEEGAVDEYGADLETLDDGVTTGEVDEDNPEDEDIVQSISSIESDKIPTPAPAIPDGDGIKKFEVTSLSID